MAYQGSITLVDLSDGQSGSSGINTATIYLYKRAATVPNKPNGTLRYTFSTHTLSGDYFNEWESSIDNLSGNNPIWIIAATATASVDIDYDDILYTEWSNPIKMAENGQDGQPGQPGQPGQDGTPGINTATVYIYQRADSTPSTPTNTSYTFATGSFIVPTNWYKEIPTTDGNPCYVASAVAISTEATTTLEWSTPVILVEDGTDGQPGLPGEPGAQGASVAIERELYYLKTNSTSVPQITEISQITSTDRQNGWTSISPTYVSGGSYYTCIETTLNNDGVTELIWSEPALNQGLTIANANASLAFSQADAVNTQLGGHFIYKGTSSGQSTPAGAGVIQTIDDNPANWGYNTWIGSNGIQLRRGEVADATLSTNGLVLSKGGIRVNTVGSNNGVYISSDNLGSSIALDNNIKTNWRAVIGSKFGVDSEGNLYANNAHLSSANVEGAITATSLTIGSGSSAYDGAAAINISGYDIEIEKNGTDEVEDVSVYLYPILYHNGIKVEEYTLSTDTTVNISKDYYTRSGSAGSYTYTIVSNPSGNPSTQLYYEKQINYSHFIWYQDDDTIGTEGDENNKGRYLATYGHNYRVIYDFDDGAVGGGTEVQTRTVDPSKYITKVSDTGITIHPEVWSNQSSYIQLDANGLNLFDSNGNSIAQYGNTARIGLSNSSRFLVNSSSLQAYDNNNNKYFEVNANGLSWGTQTAATTQQVSDLSTSITNAAKTATNYITTISDTGITIHPEVWTNQSSYIQLDGTGMELFNSNGNSIAQYGSTARIGLNNSSRFLMNSDSLEAYDSNNNKYFEVNVNGLSWGTQTAATTQQVSDLSTQMNSAIETAVDEIEIGGRNLLLNTSKSAVFQKAITAGAYSTLDAYAMVTDYSSLGLAVDDYITISFDWSITGVPSGTVTAKVGTNATPWEYFGIVNTYSAGSSSGHTEKSYKITSALASCTGTYLRFRIDSSVAVTAGAMVLTITNAKLEKGNKATDWTPAPEDLTVSKNLLGATANPTVPTRGNSAALSGFGTIGRYNSPDSEFTLEDYDGYSNSIVITSSVTGNRGVSWYTKAGEVKAGETYTFSCRVKSSVSVSVHTHTAWRNGSATSGYVGWTSEGAQTISANTWTDYTYTFTPASNAQLDWEFLVALCFTGSTSGVTCRVAHAKLERNSAATAWSEAEGDGAFTAKNYITRIDSGGIKVHDAADATSYTKLNSSGMQVYQNSIEVANFGSTARIGKPTTSNTGNVYIDNDSVDIRKGSTVLSTFTANGAEIGKNSDAAIIEFCDGTGVLTSEVDDYMSMLTLESLPANTDVNSGVSMRAAIRTTKMPDGDMIASADVLATDSGDSTFTVYLDTALPEGVSEENKPRNAIMLDMGSGRRAYYMTQDYVDGQAQWAVGCEYNPGVWIGVDVGGENHGLYSLNSNKWLIFANASTDRAFTQGHFGPSSTSTSTSTGYYLGWAANRWRQLYSYSAVNTASDRKYKDVIGDIEYAKDLIMGLEPVEFQWKDSDHKRSHMGFIAQDAAQVGKDLNKNLSFYEAHYNDGADYHGEDANDKDLEWSMMYDELIAPLVKVVQEQQKEIDKLKLKVNTLTGE